MEAAYKVVLLRHGESTWNKENRFTGWTDVELAESGIKEAHNAAKVCVAQFLPAVIDCVSELEGSWIHL